MIKNASLIFNERPPQWGLRGDPFLWDELKTHFSNMPLPYSEDHFLKEFYSAFKHYTGSDVNSKENIFCPHYNYGGMSGGWVCSVFWLEQALPILTKQLSQANK